MRGPAAGRDAGPDRWIGTPVAGSKLCLAGTCLLVAVRQRSVRAVGVGGALDAHPSSAQPAAAIRRAVGVRHALHALARGSTRGGTGGGRGWAVRIGRAIDALVPGRTADGGVGGAIRCHETLDAGAGGEVTQRAVGSASAAGVARAERMTLVILPAGVRPATVPVHQTLDAPCRLQIAGRRGHAAIDSRCTVAALTALGLAHGGRVRAVCIRQTLDAGPGGGVAELDILHAILRTVGIRSAGGLAGVIGGEAGLPGPAVAALGTFRTSAEHADG
jgi:hypothetical protein